MLTSNAHAVTFNCYCCYAIKSTPYDDAIPLIHHAVWVPRSKNALEAMSESSKTVLPEENDESAAARAANARAKAARGKAATRTSHDECPRAKLSYARGERWALCVAARACYARALCVSPRLRASSAHMFICRRGMPMRAACARRARLSERQRVQSHQTQPPCQQHVLKIKTVQRLLSKLLLRKTREKVKNEKWKREWWMNEKWKML